MTRVALYTHSVSQQHGRPSLDGPPIQHPEQPDRIASILSALEDPEFDRLVRMTAPLADVDLVKKYHDPAYVDRAIAPVPEGQVEAMDADTNKTIASSAAALRAVGAACDAIHQVVSGTVDRAFIAMRPPGHHAERARSMGFCLFGTVAIAAEEACCSMISIASPLLILTYITATALKIYCGINLTFSPSPANKCRCGQAPAIGQKQARMDRL